MADPKFPDVHSAIHQEATAKGMAPQQATAIAPVVVDALTQLLPLLVQMIITAINNHKTPVPAPSPAPGPKVP